MADRTVKVRLEADISDFVTDIGVKAVAAVNRLERAAVKANTSISGVGSSKGLDPISEKADRASERLKRTGDAAKTAGEKVKASAQTATQATEKLTETFSKSEKAVTSSSKAVTVAAKNADSYANALGRLRVAQLRLTEAQNRKGSAGTSGLAGAEEAVAAAERNVKRFEESGEKSGKSFTAGLKKWITGKGGVGDVGKTGGTVFGSGFLGVLKTPILGPAVIAILGAAIATALPAVGAAAGGAFVTAFGGGLATLGIIFAAKSDAVKTKWQSTLAQLGADMQLLAKPFQSTLINIAGYFERTVDNFNPTLGKAFSKLAGPVDQFASDFGRALEKLIPAIGPVTDAFSAVLATLGPALQDAIGNISDGMIKLSESISRSPDGLADLVTGLGDLIRQITDFITTLNNINGAFEKLTGGVSLVNVTFGILGGAVAAVAGPFQLLAKSLDLVNAAFGRTGKDSDQAGSSMSAAAAKTAALAAALDKNSAAAKGTVPPVKSAAEAAAEARKKIADAAAATDTWISSLFRLSGLALTLAGSQIAFQAAIDNVTASIKENGKSHDINTAKGRANKQALLDVAKAANDQTDAMLRSKKGVRAAADNASASRAKFIELAEKMKYTKAQAKAMADQFIKIPPKTVTDFKADISDLNSKIATAKTKLADPKLSQTKKAKLQAEIKQLLAAKAQAQAAINSLTGKTVAIRVNTYKSLIETTIHNDVGVRAPGHADGGKLGGKSPNPRADNLLFMGTAGEWVQPNASVDEYGPGFMQAVQTRKFPKELAQGYKDGGQLGYAGKRADGGFLPGGKLVDIAFLLKQLGIPFNPSAGVNYGNTLAAQNRAVGLVGSAKTAASSADRTEASAKADVARLQRAITLQQRYVAQLRREGASKSRIAAESKETIGLQDQLYRAKLKLTAATTASNKADATLKQRQDAAAAATAAHKDAIEKLIAQQQAAVDMAAQIADSLTGSANIGDLFQNSLTGKGLLQDLQGQGSALGKFGGQVTQLRKLGLSEDLIQQLVGRGAEQGGEVAQAIIDGGAALVAALNKAQKALDDQANLIGAGSANKKYGQTISGARADGGDVYKGKTYQVNERGQEFFTAPVDGHITPAGRDPRQYINGGAGMSGGTTTVVRETHVHQTNQFTGVSMSEADLIAGRSLAKLRLAGRH